MRALANDRWIISPSIDLLVFLGSAVLALAALWLGAEVGVLHGDTPDWAWVPSVLLVDVAHVYSTAFRVYLDPEERRRRPWLYTLVPLLGLLLGAALYTEGPLHFWRVLAYFAVFHFVRQQYGWVALYRARARETGRLGYWIDTLAIYAATLYPLLYWHTHLPRRFWWFLTEDFAALPPLLERICEPLYWASLGAYALRSAARWVMKREGSLGKDIVVATTAICWYAGIKTFNSDYAFTVTNVLTHGIPYLAFVCFYGQRRSLESGQRGIFKIFAYGPALFLAIVWALAFTEELVWDRAIWHERGWLFGEPFDVGAFEALLVPLLALPQLTHYVLDGFIWKRRQNPDLARVLGMTPKESPSG